MHRHRIQMLRISEFQKSFILVLPLCSQCYLTLFVSCFLRLVFVLFLMKNTHFYVNDTNKNKKKRKIFIRFSCNFKTYTKMILPRQRAFFCFFFAHTIFICSVKRSKVTQIVFINNITHRNWQ